nr:MAG: terminase large subunit [Bacteriophage sp.]
MPSFSLTEKQKECVREAHHRWNFAEGAVRSGKSWPENNFTIPDRILHGVGIDGINLLMGVSLGNIERNVSVPMREQFGEGRAYAPIMRLFGRAAIPTTMYDGVKSIIDRKMKAGEISQPWEIFESMLGEKTYGARGRKAD